MPTYNCDEDDRSLNSEESVFEIVTWLRSKESSPTKRGTQHPPSGALQAYKRRMGWIFPWASSFGGDFDYDFGVAFTEEQQQSGTVEYNFGRMDTRSELTNE